MTLGEELKSSDAAVIATLVDRPGLDRSGRRRAGEEQVQDHQGAQGRKAAGRQAADRDAVFRHAGAGRDVLAVRRRSRRTWPGARPRPLSERGIEYLEKVAQLPDNATDRLAFFQEYFEDADPLLSGDAFNEFAKAPYTDVVQLKDQMHRDKLIEWIKDDKVPASRRRLYLTMLGTCGQPADVPLIEGNDQDRRSPGPHARSTP